MGNQSSNMDISKREVGDWKKKYGLPKDKVDRTFAAFKKQSVNGQISRATFVDVMIMEGSAEKEFAETVFDSFDRDKSGTIDLREYMALMGVVFGGDIDEKLTASFKLFDEDGNGVLDRQEVEKMLILVTKSVLRRRFPDQAKNPDFDIGESNREQLKTIVDEIFNKVDVDKSGTIDEEEFKAGFREHPKICQFFKQF